MPDLSVGRIVHYRLRNGRNAGECRAALVVKTWSPEVANLHVYLDGFNDDDHGLQVLAPGAIAWATSVGPDDATGHGWHWPERTDA